MTEVVDLDRETREAYRALIRLAPDFESLATIVEQYTYDDRLSDEDKLQLEELVDAVEKRLRWGILT